MPLQLEQSLDRLSPEKDFQRDIDAITSRQLSPENINSYAEDALEDLVRLVQDIIAHQGDDAGEPVGLARERKAIINAGLDPNMIEDTLDHISEITDSTKRLDALVMKKTKLIDAIIVPPDSDDAQEIAPGSGGFEKPKEIIPKLKTLLLLLEKGFDIDIESDETLRITSGAVRPNMMRSTSYRLVEIPQLTRAVLVCDEVGNTTFVFDTNRCSEFAISAEDILALSKNDIKGLLLYEESLGRKINYSRGYANHLAEALRGQSKTSSPEADIHVSEVNILKPQIPLAPEGVLTRAQFGRQHHIQSPHINEWIAAVFGSVEALNEYKFIYDSAHKAAIRPGLTPDDQERVLEYARKECGYVDYAPEGFLSAKGISKLSGIDRESVERFIGVLDEGGELETMIRYRFGPVTTRGYSPNDIETIVHRLTKEGFFDLAPEGYLTKNGLAKALGAGTPMIIKLVGDLYDELGEIEKFKVGANQRIDHFSLRQQEVIRQRLIAHGRLQARTRSKAQDVGIEQ